MGLSHKFYNIRKKLIGEPAPVVPVVRLSGAIGAADKMGRGISMQNHAELIERAFDTAGAKAVALLINSPGGAVVQSAHLADRIRYESKKKDIPVIAFGEDVVASGGYMIALAADEIFCHQATMVGSIGVVAGGFGFTEAIKKVGVERRVYTAGESKSMLDPFKPEQEEDVTKLNDMLTETHTFFKDYVRDRRGDRLKEAEGETKLFEGDVFTGNKALELGLVDGIGELKAVLQERFGDKVEMPVVEQKKSMLSGLLPLGKASVSADQLAAGAVGHLIDAAEERAMWSRFGL